MITEWKWRMALFATVNQNTAENRTILATIFSEASGESVEDERKLFDAAIRLSISGEDPAQVLGINFAAKTTMRDDLKAFLNTLNPNQIRYYVRANTALPQHFDGELLLTNKEAKGESDIVGIPPWDIEPFDFQDALQDMFDEAGLQVIPG